MLVCVSSILSKIGMMVAGGQNKGGFLYASFQNTIPTLNLVYTASIAILHQYSSDTEDKTVSLKII
jgi:hypothetical protein